ncbi:MAG: hypothetical protein HKN23_01420 [Verrucomicrobiales bacterium]|nr:hypothetical protein [Verrucomicrobiales bacterium]
MFEHLGQLNRWSGRLLAAAFFACLLGAIPAEAQFFNRNQEPGTPTDPGFPDPVPGKIQVLKGQEVKIELTAKAKGPASIVEFLIRDFPGAGEIGILESKKNDRSKAIMTYTPKLNTAATTDKFTFSVRYPNGRWSAPAKFEIELLDAIPKITAPAVVEFGRVMVGDEVQKEIFIQNSGNAIYEKTLILPEPWHLLSPKDGKVDLAIGGSTALRVAYRPTEAAKENFHFTIHRNGGGIPQLRAESYIPFSFTQNEWQLNYDPKGFNRTAKIVVKNHSDRTLAVGIRSSDDRLKIENNRNEIYLNPKAETKVEVEIPASDPHLYEGTLELSLSNGYLTNAKVRGEVLPGRLELEIPGAKGGTLINFGDVMAGKSIQSGVVLKNVGGQAVQFEFDLEAPFEALTTGANIIGPKTAQPMAIAFSPQSTDSGLFDETLLVRSADQQLAIRLLGVARQDGKANGPSITSLRPVPAIGNGAPVSPPNGNNPAPAIGNGGTTGTRPPGAVDSTGLPAGELLNADPNRSALGFLPRPLKERRVAEHLKPAFGFALEDKTAWDTTLTFQAPPGSQDHSFEMEMLGPLTNTQTREVELVWAPYTTVEYTREGDRVSAHIKGLAPKGTYEFRIFTVNANGHSSLPSAAFAVETDMPMDWTWIYAGFGVFLLVLVGFILIQMIRKRRRESGSYHPRYGY